jgi:predicted amidophosphoribosyltransferase
MHETSILVTYIPTDVHLDVVGGYSHPYDIRFLMICTLCETLSETPISPPWLCNGCQWSIGVHEGWSSLQIDSHEITALFTYGEALRQLVLRAKTRNDVSALGVILNLCSSKITSWVSDRREEGVLFLPAPSSLWGRLKGRFDIARIVVESFFPRNHVLLQALPGTFFNAKRAGGNAAVANSRLQALIPSFFNKKEDILRVISRSTRIVVVDDVLTTGFTMSSTINLLKRLGAQTVEGLVVASSNKDLASDES